MQTMQTPRHLGTPENSANACQELLLRSKALKHTRHSSDTVLRAEALSVIIIIITARATNKAIIKGFAAPPSMLVENACQT
ncbi:hypothetical protein IG631_18129 [Alternaria alternata]|nr:hypothetical protein IG631_18129 [Alternaria alternata]